MTIPDGMQAELSHLHRVDGSATYSHGGYSIVGAVSGPIEVQRRDELPEEATVEVIVRPASGVGGIRERHLESIVVNTLRCIILTQNHPRTLIQITLQIVATPERPTSLPSAGRDASSLLVLPSLLQTAVLALSSASVALSMILTSTVMAVNRSGEVIANPDSQELQEATSVHVLAYSSHGDLLLAESEGAFSLDVWEGACAQGKSLCCMADGSDSRVGDDTGSIKGHSPPVEARLRSVLREKYGRDQSWKRELV